MATQANYAATPRMGFLRLTTASTAPDGSAGASLLITGGANGSRVDSAQFKMSGSDYTKSTTTGAVARLYYSPDAGTTKVLIKEGVIAAATPSATVAAGEVTLAGSWFLPNASAQLYATISALAGSGNCDVTAVAGDF